MASLKLLSIAFAMASVLALPQAVRAEDDLGYQAIRNHDWATAEQQLQAGLQQEPRNASRQLNLAFVYAQTGRKAEAAALYREILKNDGDRFASSPRAGKSVALLAERGLAQLKNN